METASTVGYGMEADIYYVKSTMEMLFMILMQFIGICCFALISGQLSFKKIVKLSQVIEQRVSQFIVKSLQELEFEELLFSLDQQSLIPLNNNTYDVVIKFMKESFLGSTQLSLREGILHYINCIQYLTTRTCHLVLRIKPSLDS